MKKLFALVLALVLCAGLVSFAHADDLIKVGIINLDPAESGYREANVNDLYSVFTAENGYDAKFVTAPTADKQLEAANTFITEGVDYILVSAAETTGWDETLAAAKEAGIGVFLFDRMIECDPELYTAAVVSDMRNEGVTARRHRRGLAGKPGAGRIQRAAHSGPAGFRRADRPLRAPAGKVRC